MLSVIFIWLYMGITTFIIGYGVLRVITRHIPYYTHNCVHDCTGCITADACFICGLVCVTVYAQFFSLFAGVGLAANVVLCVFCMLTVVVDRKVFAGTIRQLVFSAKKTFAGGNGSRQSSILGFCVVLDLFLIFAYGTSRGMIHYDTGLYHAQSIRWLEEYGAVKGLGNLHCRLAYNSSSFALSALYSMAFLGGQSYHCAAGWLAFLLAAFCLPIRKSLREGRLRTSDFARIMCVYYLVNVFDEMISPASDYFMVLMAFYIVIKWLDLAERGEREILPYALLCVLGVFLLTVKLSAALILLLTIYPACRLIREKRWGETGAYLGLGIVTALPFFIRNVVISGWLVYPFTQIDLFDVVWKIPKGLADYDVNSPEHHRRRQIHPDTAVADQRRGAQPKEKRACHGCLCHKTDDGQTTAGFRAQDGRGVAGVQNDRVQNRGWRLAAGRAMSVAAALLLLYKGFALAREIVGSYVNDYWIVQKEYENYETYAYEIEGVTFYCPVEGDQTGYDSFPSSPAEADIVFLGDGIEDGFRAAE